MRKIVTCEEMKRLDENTMEEYGMLSAVLMERAALSVVDEMVKTRKEDERILVVCGWGNNGGDGIAIGRILHLRGYSVSLYLLGTPSKFSKETQRQRRIADKYQVPVVNNPDFHEYTTIVDAIFGIGLAREVTGELRQIIEAINSSLCKVWAVDISSGVQGDTGQILGCAVQADYTVTFAYGKPGLYLYPAAQYCGKVLVKDIGIYEDKQSLTGTFVCEEDDLEEIPRRDSKGNKGTFGKVLVVAGSHNMAGASYFSAKATLLTGAGMVKIHTVESNRMILQQLLPEALLYTDDGADDVQEWQDNFQWADVVVLGPGLGQDLRAKKLTRFYLKACYEANKPCVVDADGLNIISQEKNLWHNCGEHTILTPHMGELARLSGQSIPKMKKDILSFVKNFAKEKHCICVAKDARTVVVDAKGDSYINLTGNSGMATAGSGDVLSGILGGLLAQGMTVADAAPVGVYLHGMAGDCAAKKTSCYSLTASDILAEIPTVLKKSEEENYGEIQSD